MGDLQRRATMQDFRNFPLHMTGELWNLVEGTDTTVSQLRKIEMLCTYLVNSLGLRHASEPTQSVMVALVCRRTDAAQQSALLQTIKAVLKTTTTRPSRQEGHCLVTYIWSSCLRAKISFLLPTGLTLATLAIMPVPPGVSLDTIWQAARTTPLRNRNQQLVIISTRIPSYSWGKTYESAGVCRFFARRDNRVFVYMSRLELSKSGESHRCFRMIGANDFMAMDALQNLHIPAFTSAESG